MVRAALAWLAPLAVAISCVPQNAGYEDVQNVVARTGHEVRWRHVDQSGKLDERASGLLAAPLTTATAVKLALVNNAELQAMFEELGMARGDLIRALRLPNPSAEGGVLYDDGSASKVELSLSRDLTELILLPMRMWSTGPIAEIEVPLFYQGQGEVARAEAEMRRQEQHYNGMDVRIRAALRAVQVRASTARERALYLKNTLLPMRDRILNETQLQFNVMNTSVFQLLIARRDQIEAGRSYVESLREYWLASADLEQLLAGRMPEGAMTAPGASFNAPTASEAGTH